MPRVIAGRVGGRRFAAPPGRRTRPTSDRVREALFSSLAAALEGAVVLDLYAGSGALAIEALSRGASRAVLVESDPRAARTAERNLAALGLDTATVRRQDVAAYCAAPVGGPFDVVLADPPYATPAPTIASALATLAHAGALEPGCRIVVERRRREASELEAVKPSGMIADGLRTYGETSLVRWRAGGERDRQEERMSGGER